MIAETFLTKPERVGVYKKKSVGPGQEQGNCPCREKENGYLELTETAPIRQSHLHGAEKKTPRSP